MNKQMIRRALIGAAALVSVTGMAIAGSNTIAGSGKSQTLSAEMSRTLVTGLSDLAGNGTNICVTIVNRSDKTGLIRLTLSDEAAATSMMDIAKGKSTALCVEDGHSATVNCIGPSKCAFTWNVDKF